MRRHVIWGLIALAIIVAYALSTLQQVPNATGSYQVAGDVLRDSGFEVAVVDTSKRPHEAHDLEVVVGQTPKAGALRPFGSIVTLTTTPPTGTAVVPDVVGRRVSDAVDAVHDAGLSLDTGGVILEDGIVTETLPGAGSRLAFGSRVAYSLETP